MISYRGLILLKINMCTEAEFVAWKNNELFFDEEKSCFYSLKQLETLLENLFVKTTDETDKKNINIAIEQLKQLNLKEFIRLVNIIFPCFSLYTYEEYMWDCKMLKPFSDITENNKMIGFVKPEPSDKTTSIYYDDNIKNELDARFRKHMAIKERHRITRKNENLYKRKLSTLSKLRWYPAPAYKIIVKDKTGRNTYFRRDWKSRGKDSSYTFFKKQFNKNVRHKANAECHNFKNLKIDDAFFDENDFEEYIPQHNSYHKKNDLMWTCF